MILLDNSNMKLRFRLSGETWPPFIVYKFISVNDNNGMLPYINTNQYHSSQINQQTFIKSQNTNVKSVSLHLALNS